MNNKNKKKTKRIIKTILWIITIALLIGFMIKTWMDYLNYSPIENSAPFGVWILYNACWFIASALNLILINIFLIKIKKEE